MKIFIHSNEKLIGAAILVIRVTLGVLMFAHGAQKVFGVFGGKGLDATVDGMSKGLGMPSWLAYLSCFTELVGGIGIILGVLTRFFSIAVLINMLVAVFAVHFKNGLLGPGGFEFPGSLAMLALTIALAGPGMLSLDHVLFHPKAKNKS